MLDWADNYGYNQLSLGEWKPMCISLYITPIPVAMDT